METEIPTEPFFNYPVKILGPEAINPSIPPSIRSLGAQFPALVTVQDFETKENVYINDFGCNFLEHNIIELLAMGKGYYDNFFSREETEVLELRMQKLVKKQRINKTISFFQRIRPNDTTDYSWFFTTSQLYSLLQKQEIYFLHISLPVNKCSYMGKKLDTLVEENLFLRKNYGRFKRLSEREKEIMELISKGTSSRKIADLLCLSIHTVNNHRKNIIHKIGKKNLNLFLRLNSAFRSSSF